MRIQLAARYGFLATLGVVPLALGTQWFVQTARERAIRPGDAQGTVLLVSIAGTAAILVFLFAVIGAYLDRELAARGVDTQE